jgi:hypothetical protein
MKPMPGSADPLNVVRTHIREAIRALQEDIDGEKIRDVERHVRAADVLLNRNPQPAAAASNHVNRGYSEGQHNA